MTTLCNLSHADASGRDPVAGGARAADLPAGQADEALLVNIAWHSLAGLQREHAAGSGQARRYRRGYAPIIAFADPARPDFDPLVAHCDAGESFYCDGWTGRAPRGWRVTDEAAMVKMVWSEPLPPEEPAAAVARLDHRHVGQALALAALTRPGPIGARSFELGDYLGVFEHGRLIAMAGERMHAGSWREISAVCTHPDARGRGLAGMLVRELVRRHRQRDERSFLHVMLDNAAAHRLYRELGFADRHVSVVRVVTRTGQTHPGHGAA